MIAKPPMPKRPSHGHIKVGGTILRVKIDWAEYEAEAKKHGKPPETFTVWGFNKKYRVRRENLTFVAGTSK